MGVYILLFTYTLFKISITVGIKQQPNIKEAESMLLNVSGKLLMFQRDHSGPQIKEGPGKNRAVSQTLTTLAWFKILHNCLSFVLNIRILVFWCVFCLTIYLIVVLYVCVFMFVYMCVCLSVCVCVYMLWLSIYILIYSNWYWYCDFSFDWYWSFRILYFRIFYVRNKMMSFIPDLVGIWLTDVWKA